MASYQLCDLDEFLNFDDGFMSPDEFIASVPAPIQESIKIPEEEIFQNSVIDNAEKVVEGEITQMLRITPGILPPVDCFPKSYKPPKSTELPDFIPHDRYNKIPILLAERFFKFDLNDDDAEIENVREVVNNLDGCSNGNVNGKSIGRGSRSRQNRTSPIDEGSNQSRSDSQSFEKRFLNVFTNDISDDDNCNIRSSPDSSSHEIQVPQKTAIPVQQYYNARQLYELKRGKKQ